MKPLSKASMIFVLTFMGHFAGASVITFIDLTDKPTVTIDGQVITGNGGKVSNFITSGELISFSLTTSLAFPFGDLSSSRDLLECAGCGISDRLVYTLSQGSLQIGVQFGSDPSLPLIPDGAQILPPLVEDGSPQLVNTYNNFINGANLESFYIQSDVTPPDSDIPEPASWLLAGTGAVLGLFTETE